MGKMESAPALQDYCIMSMDLPPMHQKVCKKLTAEAKPVRQEKEKIPNFYKEVELTLTAALGRKISVSKSKGKQGGVLQIEFYSDEELTELSNKLS